MDKTSIREIENVTGEFNQTNKYKEKPLLFKIRRSIRHGFRHYTDFKVQTRLKVGQSRLIPDFMIIGAQKCGTSSLFINLAKHPQIIPSIKIEVHYFDSRNFQKDFYWYRAHFPTVFYRNYLKKVYHKDIITYEATPSYLFHPHAPRRVFEKMSHIKFIVLLRNPVNRAYSHYHHTVGSRKKHMLSFEDSVEMMIQEDPLDEIQKALEDETYWNAKLSTYSYLSRGIYVDQLKRWMQFFPRENFLIIKSEDYFKDSPAIYQQVLKFLNLPNYEPKDWKYGKFIKDLYPKMDENTRKKLVTFFEPYNKTLYKFLGRDFGWEKE